jgi:hypothetical protein
METPYATSLLHLSTVAAQKNSNQPWVKFQSAGWVNIQSAPTDNILLDAKGWPKTNAESFSFIKAMKARYEELRALKNELGEDDFIDKHEAKASAQDELDGYFNHLTNSQSASLHYRRLSLPVQK